MNNTIEKRISDIYGQGYGDSHSWKRGQTAQVGSNFWAKGTVYFCGCGASFNHAYDLVPDIFQAIEQWGVVDKCPLKELKPNE
jgi:hypothetical protein